MTDHQSRRSSITEPVASIESDGNDTITALVNSNPLYDSNTRKSSKDDIPQRSRRRSSLSIIQALVNTSHLLTTHDARKRYI
jgi:hypothetical protein